MGAATASATNNPLDKALGWAGLISPVFSTVASFVQMGKQQRLQRQAEADAAKAMAEARKAIDVNYYDTLAIQKEPYELQREALLSTGAQSIQAGVESERGAAATAGRVVGAMAEAQGGIRKEMGKELSELEKLSATEESRLRDIGVQLDLAEVAGQQQMAADAARMKTAAAQQAFQSAQGAIQQGIRMANLYPKTKTEDTGAKTAQDIAATTATSQPTGQTGMVPTTKLSPFPNMPSPRNLYEQYMIESATYQGGSKLGSPIKMPSAVDMYNYFNPIR